MFKRANERKKCRRNKWMNKKKKASGIKKNEFRKQERKNGVNIISWNN